MRDGFERLGHLIEADRAASVRAAAMLPDLQAEMAQAIGDRCGCPVRAEAAALLTHETGEADALPPGTARFVLLIALDATPALACHESWPVLVTDPDGSPIGRVGLGRGDALLLDAARVGYRREKLRLTRAHMTAVLTYAPREDAGNERAFHP